LGGAGGVGSADDTTSALVKARMYILRARTLMCTHAFLPSSFSLVTLHHQLMSVVILLSKRTAG